jgi:hypothetical protein
MPAGSGRSETALPVSIGAVGLRPVALGFPGWRRSRLDSLAPHRQAVQQAIGGGGRSGGRVSVHPTLAARSGRTVFYTPGVVWLSTSRVPGLTS